MGRNPPLTYMALNIKVPSLKSRCFLLSLSFQDWVILLDFGLLSKTRRDSVPQKVEKDISFKG